MIFTGDWIFTGTSGIIQPISGLALAWLTGIPLTEPWLIVAYALYVIAFLCWLPVVWLQIKAQRLAQLAVETEMPLSQDYYRTMRYWFVLGWPAFLGLMVVFWLMIAKPALW